MAVASPPADPVPGTAILTGKRLTSICLLILLALSACDTPRRDLRLVTPASLVDREIAQELTSLLNGKSSFQVTMTASPMAGRKAFEAIAVGDADIALVSNYLEFRDDIATIMPLYPTVLHIARRSGNDVLVGPEMFHDSTVSRTLLISLLGSSELVWISKRCLLNYFEPRRL